MVALYDAVDAATLFASTRPWHLRRQREHETVAFTAPYGRTMNVLRFLDLPDGTFIGYAHAMDGLVLARGRQDALEPSVSLTTHGDTYIDEMTGLPQSDDSVVEVIPRQRRSQQKVEQVELLRISIAALLLKALASGGATELQSDGLLAKERLLRSLQDPT